MQTIEKQVINRSTKKLKYSYTLAIAENIAECLQLCNGNEREVVSFFNVGYAEHVKKQSKPKPSSRKKSLTHAVRSVSAEVRARLATLTEEEQYELIQKAKTQTQS